jgi:hypothetical protein
MVSSVARVAQAHMAADKKGRKAKTPESGTAKSPGIEEGERTSKAELVSKVLQKMEQKLASDALKPTVGDFIRLLQLEKELAEEAPKEIEVSWVEPEEKSEKDQKDDAPVK